MLNSPVELAEVSKQWKIFFVIPVHMKCNKHNALNYRSISLTSGFSRIFEHTISIKIINHLFDYNLLSDKQFGFVPNRSSNIQLLTCLHSWIVSYLKKESIKVVYNDFIKVFDSVLQKRLLEIWSQYGLHECLAK